MKSRNEISSSRWAGVWRIVRFNWPFYLFSSSAALTAVFLLPQRGLLRAAMLAIAIPGIFWTVTSLLASHWIYDRSPLAGWSWLPAWLPGPPGRWLAIQTGFDATQGRLRELLPASPLLDVELFGMTGVGGASVRRARHESPTGNAGAISARLPDEAAVCDTIIAIFSLHEVRDANTRAALFFALARALAPGGHFLLVEHLRDWRNFLVYGPGFLHFSSEGEWRRCTAAAGLRLDRTESFTPFVRAFLWSKP